MSVRELERRTHQRRMSKRMKKHIDIMMNDGKPRNISQILDALYESRKRNTHMPTRQELINFLTKNYSKEMRYERHPLSLSISDENIRTPYFRKVIE